MKVAAETKMSFQMVWIDGYTISLILVIDQWFGSADKPWLSTLQGHTHILLQLSKLLLPCLSCLHLSDKKYLPKNVCCTCMYPTDHDNCVLFGERKIYLIKTKVKCEQDIPILTFTIIHFHSTTTWFLQSDLDTSTLDYRNSRTDFTRISGIFKSIH